MLKRTDTLCLLCVLPEKVTNCIIWFLFMESNVLRHFCYFSHLGWACLFVLKNMFLANVKVIFTLKLNTGDIQHNNNKEIEHKRAVYLKSFLLILLV